MNVRRQKDSNWIDSQQLDRQLAIGQSVSQQLDRQIAIGQTDSNWIDRYHFGQTYSNFDRKLAIEWKDSNWIVSELAIGQTDSNWIERLVTSYKKIDVKYFKNAFFTVFRKFDCIFVQC